MLSVRHLDVYYGEIKVLWGINIEVQKGEIVSLIGANGAGKSTLLNTISGLIKPRNGEIFYNNESIKGYSCRETVKKCRITLLPEGRRLFGGMTVRDNILMGAYVRNDKRGIVRDLKKIFEYFPILEERQSQLAVKLSGGEQQMCVIGRALMSNPKVLLIDEFSLGLAPLLVQNLLEIVKDINKQGTTILYVDQDVQTALGISNRCYVLGVGRILKHDYSKNLLSDNDIKKAYLGI